ncbi:MAG: shikimate kinase, partial [Acidobacteria bacterium]|nr:shikimate kinase [Acidobacteriota bacterium]
MRTDKLYIVGFMGAGKTTVAAALGRRIGWRTEDVDQRIEARERRSVSAIFS